MITTANIKSMMLPLFDHWIKTVGGGQGPRHIYYFRDGVSEGQYAHVLEQEVNDMKKAIKEIYKVDVTAVNMINRHPKRKRFAGRMHGSQEGYRKAIVTLKEGQKIDIH